MQVPEWAYGAVSETLLLPLAGTGPEADGA